MKSFTTSTFCVLRFITLIIAFVVPSMAAWGASGISDITGLVICDANGNGHIDGTETGLSGIGVILRDLDGNVIDSVLTDATGRYTVHMPDGAASYSLTIDGTTLADGASVVLPASGEYIVEVPDEPVWLMRDFLLDSPECRDQAKVCWMTAGGVKFEPVYGGMAAERGPRDSFGGNVNPSCSPEPGDGGQWNHVAHSLKLHFLGQSIRVVRCGNVEGIEAGSESPVTPYNYIEFEGEGTLSGIKGNKFPKTQVSFFARVEDRNEPGNEAASDGEDVDRYFLHVFESGGAITHILVDEDADATNVDPVTITGGNLQLHISSCDDPPNF